MGTIGERAGSEAAGVGAPTNQPGAVERWVASARAAIENLGPQELEAELASSTGAVFLVDVRGAEEYRSGCIAGSVNFPRGRLELECAGAAWHRRVVLYCDTGERSALAADRLYELGFDDVAHLDGGLTAWADAGLPLGHPAAPNAAGPAHCGQE